MKNTWILVHVGSLGFMEENGLDLDDQVRWWQSWGRRSGNLAWAAPGSLVQ